MKNEIIDSSISTASTAITISTPSTTISTTTESMSDTIEYNNFRHRTTLNSNMRIVAFGIYRYRDNDDISE